MSKIQKTIARQQEKIAEGQYYEAHQQLRVVASRYVKQANWDAALDILHGGALALLKAGQGGSGGDLGLYFIDTLVKAKRTPESENKGKIFALLRAFPLDEPTRKRFVGESVAWTACFGEYDNGDPELHHVVGILYAEGYEPYEAERHFALGTKDSPDSLSRLEYDWYLQDDSHTAALYAARAIFPYLLLKNLRYANKAYTIFTSRLSTDNKALTIQDVSNSTSDIRIYPSLPLLNFVGLLLLAVQRGGADLFRTLTRHYATHVAEVGIWNDALAQVGEIYFGIRIPKQGNPLFDMMGSMLFGGAQPSTPKTKSRKLETAPPPVDLD